MSGLSVRRALVGEKDIEYWAALYHERGHAGVFAKRDRQDLEIIERGTTQEWATSMFGEFGAQVTSIKSAPTDGPDCTALLDGSPVTIELTELVKAEVLAAADRGRKNGKRVTSHDALFHLAQWDRAHFQNEIDRLLDIKNSKRLVDFLVIHTAEPWLSPLTVEEWLLEIDFSRRASIGEAYLLVNYHPAYRPYWPVFRIF